MIWSSLALSYVLIQGVAAIPHPQADASTAPPSTTVSTATPSPTAASSDKLPSQKPLPPVQEWCPSQIFCAGQVLQSLNLAKPFVDSKTIVDKPTSKSSKDVLADFKKNDDNSDVTVGAIVDFLNDDFSGEGRELEPVGLTNFNPEPAFLKKVNDPVVKGFSQTVHTYWTQLIRKTNETTICKDGSCESTLIPLNHTFVVPGGRFREQYYWDSYWIVKGLIESELFDIVKDTLENFMDEIEDFGFIPNGGRIYYLNRSQPPVFIRMLAEYVEASKDTDILTRALPIAEAELKWWKDKRTVEVTSPFSQKKYTVARYAVTNTAPRPESYLPDYNTAFDPELPELSEKQRSDLYAELASGAESGWDYSSRWMSQPLAGSPEKPNASLRSLNVRATIPVCLNSILAKAHNLIADLYEKQRTADTQISKTHRTTATNYAEAVLDLMWDKEKLAFYDFNLTSQARNSIFTAATFYPLWNGIIPDELLSSSEKAFGFFSSLNLVLNRYTGTFPVTFLETGQQWDAPNAWPPHQHIALEALRALPSNVTSGALPTPPDGQSTYALIPAGQLDLAEDKLPKQSITGKGDAPTTGASADSSKTDGTVTNGGNKRDGEGWAAQLQRELANRYVTSALCSWHATGGSLPNNLLPRLSAEELNLTQSVDNTGNMFEKFAMNDIDSAGRGGEYTVQAGFGWTNGALLWVASNYGDVLVKPTCPDIRAELQDGGKDGGKNAAVGTRAAPAIVAALAVLSAAFML